MQYTINASNLHVGGGVQVAASFISEIPPALRSKFTLILSSEVLENLTISENEIKDFFLIKIINTSARDLWRSALNSIIRDSHSIFTIFGPLYKIYLTAFNIVGFAQPWIIYPENDLYKKLSLKNRLFTKIKYSIQLFFFKRADILVVELDHVKNQLVKLHKIHPKKIHVIHNSISSVFLNLNKIENLKINLKSNCLRLGFIGRNYIHKNTSIFPKIHHILKSSFDIECVFYVTFTSQEWLQCSKSFRQSCCNLGPMKISQCPSFYQNMDAIVFPSLLECFSATPLEALVMEKPLFASDRQFNRDICGDHAHYFDPLSPESAARAIAKVFLGGGPKKEDLLAAKQHAINFSSPKVRAEQYLALLMQAGNNINNNNRLTRT